MERDHPIGAVLDALAAAGPGARAAVPLLAEIGQAELARFQAALHPDSSESPWAQVGYQEPWGPGRRDALSTAMHAAATRYAIDADPLVYLASLDAVAATLAELQRLREDARRKRARRQSLNGHTKDCARLADLAAGYGRLGPDAGAERVAPLLRHLGDDRPAWHNADVWIAWAHWRATGETQVALTVLVDVLRSERFHPTGDRQLPALRLFADLVPSAEQPLAGELATALRALTEGDTRIEFNGDGARGRIVQDQELRRRAAEALAALRALRAV
jgi:hypothetical protein